MDRNYLSYGSDRIDDADLLKIEADLDDMTAICQELQFLRHSADELREELDALHKEVQLLFDSLEGTLSFKLDG